ncbi:MAG: hypothetical protein ACREH8_00100, partial [Opitutaceae bacterium]
LEPRRLRRHYATHRASKRIVRGLKATAILGWSRRDLCRKAWRDARGRRGVPPPRLDLMGKMPMPLRSA